MTEEDARHALLSKANLLGRPINQRLNRICSAAVALTKADQVEINIVAGRELQHLAYYPPSIGIVLPCHFSEQIPCQVVVTTEEPVIMSRVPHHSKCPRLCWANQVKSYLGVPVFLEGSAVASLCAYAVSEIHEWTPVEITVMQGIAELVSANFSLSMQSQNHPDKNPDRLDPDLTLF